MNLRAAVLALGVVVGLSACAAPTLAPSPAPTATVDDSVADNSAAEIAITAERVSVMSGSGVELSAFDYFEDAQVAVGILAEAFGSEPAVEQVKGLDSPGYTRYDWTGFQLQALDEGTDRYPPLRVSVLVTDVGDVRIATADGISVGQDADALAARYPDAQVLGGTYSITLRQTTIGGFSVYLGVTGQVGGPVTSITAPQVQSAF